MRFKIYSFDLLFLSSFEFHDLVREPLTLFLGLMAVVVVVITLLQLFAGLLRAVLIGLLLFFLIWRLNLPDPLEVSSLVLILAFLSLTMLAGLIDR